MKGTTHILAMPRRTMSLLFRPTMSQASTCSQSLSAPLSLSLSLVFVWTRFGPRALGARGSRMSDVGDPCRDGAGILHSGLWVYI